MTAPTEHADCTFAVTDCCNLLVDLDCEEGVSNNREAAAVLHLLTPADPYGDAQFACKAAYQAHQLCADRVLTRPAGLCGEPVFAGTDQCPDHLADTYEDRREQAAVDRAEAEAGR